jgi:hypothetical protein
MRGGRFREFIGYYPQSDKVKGNNIALTNGNDSADMNPVVMKVDELLFFTGD